MPALGSRSMSIRRHGEREKRHAQQRVVQMILPENFDDAVPEISLEGARNDAE